MQINEYVPAAIRTESSDYAAIAARLLPGVEIGKINVSDALRLRLLHHCMGLMTEIGEMIDQLKCYIYYGKDLDVTNLFEEFGDLNWYMACMADTIAKLRSGDFGDGASLWMEALAKNIDKLKARYPDKFEMNKAVNRDLEQERKALEE